MVKTTILVITSDPAMGRLLEFRLSSGGFQPIIWKSMDEVDQCLREDQPDIAILDFPSQGTVNWDLLAAIKSHELPALVLCKARQSGDALKAIRNGADATMLKPIDSDAVIRAVKKLLEVQRKGHELEFYRQKNVPDFDDTAWFSKSYGTVRIQAGDFAAAGVSPILIQGETGTGKEVMARYIHRENPGRSKLFIPVNLAALPEDLIESELFGHESGSFTGATQRKRGLIELAQGGTLFLDEIGSISLSVQGKLLRFLETKNFRRVGGLKDHNVEARLVAATNLDLWSASEQGIFRKDLFYRLQAGMLRIPPLRDRQDDIPKLIEVFLVELGQQYKRKALRLAPESLEALVAYDWPGNVRELRNLIERAVLLTRGTILRPDQFLERRAKIKSGRRQNSEPMVKSLREVEKEHIRETLEHFGGNISLAARVLGISRLTLRRKLSG